MNFLLFMVFFTNASSILGQYNEKSYQIYLNEPFLVERLKRQVYGNGYQGIPNNRLEYVEPTYGMLNPQEKTVIVNVPRTAETVNRQNARTERTTILVNVPESRGNPYQTGTSYSNYGR